VGLSVSTRVKRKDMVKRNAAGRGVSGRDENNKFRKS